MAYYRSVGAIPPKRHTQFRRDSGELHYEELVGEEGFSSDSSLLYHRGIPSAITSAEVSCWLVYRFISSRMRSENCLARTSLFPVALRDSWRRARRRASISKACFRRARRCAHPRSGSCWRPPASR